MRKNVYIVIGVLALILGVLFYMRNLNIPKTMLITAVKEHELSGESYILCKRARTTGFDWIIVRNENGEKAYELCNIIGPNPFVELELSYEFAMANNTYIFYIEEKKVYYSEETKQDTTEYRVTGWDILYPVKHSDVPILFGTKKYITKSDIRK